MQYSSLIVPEAETKGLASIRVGHAIARAPALPLNAFETASGFRSSESVTRHQVAELKRMASSPASSAGRFLLQLQRRYGNRHVQRVLTLSRTSGPLVQRQDGGPSQTTDLGSLDISVQDGKTFAPIAGAKVHIDQAGVSGTKSIDLVTDRNGNTSPIELEEGNYTITVTARCCDPQTFNTHVDPGTSNFVFVTMKNCECRISSEDSGSDDMVSAAVANRNSSA